MVPKRVRSVAKNKGIRIFISHASEDNAIVRLLQGDLVAAGADVWVDHVGIRGGDNFAIRINNALRWCNVFLLLWSKNAKRSYWVRVEWTSALALEKMIIPCRIDKTSLPEVLRNTSSIEFSDNDKGLYELLRGLGLVKVNSDRRNIDSNLAV